MDENKKKCSSCLAEFSCGALNTKGCWCMQFPRVLRVENELGCLCPVCLERKIAETLLSDLYAGTFEEKLTLAKKCYFPSEKLIEGLDYVLEEGNCVFSAWYLLKRGYCCGSGCRRCPYSGS